jgi:hypothetical protein
MSVNPQKLSYLVNNQMSNDRDMSYDAINNRLNNSISSNITTSKTEMEMQRKVKTILKKDILSRYRKSPYLKTFAKL